MRSKAHSSPLAETKFHKGFLYPQEQIMYFAKKLKDIVYGKFMGKCAYCGMELLTDDGERCFQIDHIIPQSKGGTNSIENLFPACGYCNCQKRTMSLEKFRKVLFDERATDHRFYFERTDLHT
jgi:5-methylcytosine-specific restriction endonuclease McrA